MLGEPVKPETTQLLDALRATAARPLEDALAFPPKCYVSEDFLALEREKIFYSEWHCIGRADELAEPGSYLTFEIADEPVFVCRDKHGALRAFSNICRHRMGRLLTGSGTAARIVCPYHAWTYALDGRLIGAPFMGDGFDATGICLPAFPVEVWEGWVYTTLCQDAPPLAPRLAELGRRVGNYRMADYRCLFRVDEVWETNWKALVENFTESYHLFHVHRNTVDPALPTRMTRHDEAGTEAFNILYQFRRPGSSFEHEGDAVLANQALTDEEQRKYPLACIYPAHLIAISPERLFWVSPQPIDSSHIRVRWGLDIFPGALPEGAEGEKRTAELRAAFERINDEDKGILREVRRNAASRHAAPGPLSPKERSVWEFQCYLAGRLCP